ncbi:MAG TPA: DUF6152 family protein [Gammaproteobacteria bacterium]|nr:DUF6152 family protein [Gammaproteobacteria bacterium]
MKSSVLVAASALVFSAPAGAHHSPAMLYDLAGHIELEGIVTEYSLGNPHMRIYLDVDNEGTIEKWMAEGGSRTVLLRKGWDGTEVSSGDRVTVRGHPTRDGSKVVHLEYLVLPDGTELYGEDLDRGQLEDIRRRRD